MVAPEQTSTRSRVDKMSILPTATKLATDYGVDERTIRRDGQFARAVDVVKEADARFQPS